MKEILNDLNKAFENKVRLGVMSALVVNDHMDFNTLKNLLDVTDGNLASHLKSLEKSAYIKVKKEFIERKPNTQYSITSEGQVAFTKHIRAIEQLLKH
ncbi:MAG: transcriptional regulator [Cyclobacteriaceae bacterium]